jgi:protease I
MKQTLDGKRIAFLTANEGVEQFELTSPWAAALDAGAEPVHIAPEVGAVQGFEHLDKASVFEATLAAADADPSDFDALVLPGGVANPDQLRTDDASVAFVRAAARAGVPIAVICHGPWTLIEADVVRGRTLTSWPSLATDLRNAGASWVDEAAVTCTAGPGPIVSSRKPDDLEAFNHAFVEAVAQTAHEAAGTAS